MCLFRAKRFALLVCLGVGLLHGPPRIAAANLTALLSPTNFWKYNDESLDLGSAWIAPDYNDNGWSNGLSTIGFRAANNANYPLPPPNVIRTVPRKTTSTNSSLDIMTFYFRTHFIFTNDPGGLTLTASNLIDDGAIFYLNGHELTRVAMPDGPVSWGTTATRGTLLGTNRTTVGNLHGYDVFSVPVEALVQGDNVMAAEVHQVTPTSLAMAFQMELWADYPTPTQLTITTEPPDVSVEEGKPTSLQAGISGEGARYQWYRQGVGPIAGAFTDRYSIPVASTNDSGFYYLVITNLISTITSRVAQVTVTLDTSGPALIDADGSASPTSVLVSFSESILQSTATNIANYQITNTLGGTLAVTRAALTNATNVVLTTAGNRLANNNYILIVNGVRDTSQRTNLIVTNSMIPISNLGTIIDLDSDGWQFYDPYPPFDAPDLGTAWKELAYSGTNVWGNGRSVFFNGLDASSIPGPVNTLLSQTPTYTSYFRYPLTGLQFSSGKQRLLVTHVIDDGAILYLNGVEFYRFNMPASPVNFQTRASTTIPNPTRIGPITLTNSFLPGANVIAAELHQMNQGDVDKVFGIRVDAYIRSVAVGPAIITGGPDDITVIEGQPATFEVVQVGGSSFQWQQNSNTVSAPNSDAYTITGVPLSLNGAKFRVIVNGAGGTVTSTNATLHVVPDTNAPTLMAAFASTNSIVISFSESMAVASANNVANYFVTNSAGQSFIAATASLTNGTNVALSFGNLPPAIYFVVVNNVRDSSLAGNTIAPNSTVKAGFSADVQAITGSWKYDQSNVSLGTSWNGRTFDDTAWPVGTALFNGKYNAPVPALPEPAGTVLDVRRPSNAATNIPTYYFRKHFSSYASGSGTITFRTIVDDGCVVYLNGLELLRLGMPNGTITFGTPANRTVGDVNNNDTPSYEGPFTFSISNLVVGDNVIAVEAHQVSSTSSDIYWGGEFSVFSPSILITNVPVSCTSISFAPPMLRSQRASVTNVILSWTNPVTNSCGSNAVFTLQQALTLTNPPSLNSWSNVTTVSPYTAVGTNKSRFFRLKQ